MDIRKIKKLIELLEESGIAELEIKEGEESVRISRQSSPIVQTVAPVAAPIAAPPVGATPTPAVETPAAETGHQVKSPMVGTFYTSPDPEADSFVSIGSKVSADTTVCIVEAMKVMNEIKAEIGGEIVEFGFVVDLPELLGKEKLNKWSVFTLVEFEGE